MTYRTYTLCRMIWVQWPLSNILCIYICTIGHRHQHEHHIGIGISLGQGLSIAMYKVVWHQQATCIHGNLFTNILCIYIHTIGQGHQHGDHSGIGIGLRQGMTAATYKVLWHRQATLIHENFQSVSASAINSYLWQMTKCYDFSLSGQLLHLILMLHVSYKLLFTQARPEQIDTAWTLSTNNTISAIAYLLLVEYLYIYCSQDSPKSLA